MKKNSFRIAALTLIFIYFGFVPAGRSIVREHIFKMQDVDQEINYVNRKKVEDTARSMISNYQYAKSEYETYKFFCKDSVYDKEKCQRALDSKSSANRTVSTYNNYLLKNNFLFKQNMPKDIYEKLEKIEE